MDSQPVWIKQYDMGVPASITYPSRTLVAQFDNAAHEQPENICMIDAHSQVSYRETSVLVTQLAARLQKVGLKKGDTLGICLPNCMGFVQAYFAGLKCGGVIAAMNPLATQPELLFQLQHAKVRHLVCHQTTYEQLKDMLELTQVRKCIILDENARSDENNLLLLRDEYATALPQQGFEDVDLSPDDPAVLQFSGGTTGIPHCAVGLHKNIVANVIQFAHWLNMEAPANERILTAIPLYHVYGMVLCMNLAIHMRAAMILVSNPRDMAHLLTMLDEHKASIFPGVPNIYHGINAYIKAQPVKYSLKSLKACISGSATLPLQVKNEFEKNTGAKLVEGYGLSEAPTATHCNPVYGKNKDGSIGLPLPDVNARIVDLENGLQEQPVGETGELIIKAPQLMAGYFESEEATSQVIRDGWLFTGDIARMDDEGYFFLVDRKKDLIKVGGLQVWPSEVERVINAFPGIREACVAGIPNFEGGEIVKAWVVLEDGLSLDQEALLHWCQRSLSRYKIPKIIETREKLPRSAVGKILRRVLVEETKA